MADAVPFVTDQSTAQPTSPPAEIFEARSYEDQVLGLAQGQTEQDLDEEYIADAQDANIEMLATPAPAKDSASSWLSTNTLSIISPRRSDSTDSYRSTSTGLTSNFSKTSTDHYYTTHPYHLRFRSLSRPSLAETELDESIVPTTPVKNGFSLPVISSVSQPFTTLSMPLSPSRRSFSVRRGFDRLSKLTWTANASTEKECFCFRCATTGGPNLGPFFALPCNHDVCRPHLRQLVVDSLRSSDCKPPQCCGRSIPRVAIHAVARQDEEDRLFPPPPNAPPPRTSSIPRLPADIKQYSVDRGRMLRANTGNLDDSHAQRSTSEEAQRNLRCAMACTNFKALRKMQEDQRSRFLKFKRTQRDSLKSYHIDLRKAKGAEHAKQIETLLENHQQAVAKLEDKHVAAEIDLRQAQEQEKRNCLLKLRHMENYINGTGATSTPNASLADLLNPQSLLSSAFSTPTPDLALSVTSLPLPPTTVSISDNNSTLSLRTVTDQDRKELTRQYWERDHLPSRHTSAINVLREQQGRQTRLAAVKQEAEQAALERRHTDELAALDQTATAEMQELEDIFMRRRQRLTSRWELAAEIWKRRQADEGVLLLPFPIAEVEWPAEAGAEGVVC